MSKDAHQRPPEGRVISTIAALNFRSPPSRARVAKSVDARDLKSLGFNQPCRFESGSGHQWNSFRKNQESYFTRNHASLTDPAEVGALLRAIDGYEGQPITAAALKLAPLVFVRPRELRGARWVEFDLDGVSGPIAAHPERNKVRAAYNKAQRLAERRKMMQTWADHLDCLRTGKDIDIPTSST